MYLLKPSRPYCPSCRPSLTCLLRQRKLSNVRDGGVAWRGYMLLGGEHTHGCVNWKEELYVGPKHANGHSLTSLPLHSKNQFPNKLLPGMRPAVLEYVNEVVELEHTLTNVFSLGLGLNENELRKLWLNLEPVVLF